ncbi:MAG: hypothetical protein ACLQMF_17265 [Rectinemataceae bacterium]
MGDIGVGDGDGFLHLLGQDTESRAENEDDTRNGADSGTDKSRRLFDLVVHRRLLRFHIPRRSAGRKYD